MNSTTIFSNRYDAGMRLGQRLMQGLDDDDRVVVLGLPLGGVEVAAAVADCLGSSLDLALVTELTAEDGTTIGAVTDAGVEVMDTRLRHRETPSGLEFLRRRAERALERDADLYRDYRPVTDVEGSTVVLVGDSMSSAAAMLAAITSVRLGDPSHVAVAVPIGSHGACEAVGRVADALVCIGVPLEPYRDRDFFAEFGTRDPADVVSWLMSVNGTSTPVEYDESSSSEFPRVRPLRQHTRSTTTYSGRPHLRCL